MKFKSISIAAISCASIVSPSILANAETTKNSAPKKSTFKQPAIPSSDKYRRNTVPKVNKQHRRIMTTTTVGFSHAFVIFRSWLITLLAIRVAVLFSVNTWRHVKKALREMDDADYRLPFLHIEVRSKSSVSTMSSQSAMSSDDGEDSMESFLQKLTDDADESVKKCHEPKKVHGSSVKKTRNSLKMKDDDSLDSFMKILDDDESTVATAPITSSDNSSRSGNKRHDPNKVLGPPRKKDFLSKLKVKSILSKYGLEDDSSESSDSISLASSDDSCSTASSDLISRSSRQSESSRRKVILRPHSLKVDYGNDNKRDAHPNACGKSDDLIFPASSLPACGLA